MTEQQTHNPPAGDLMPVPVHVTGVADGVELAGAPKAKPACYYSEYLTVLLTVDDPVQGILPASDNRVIAWVQALDNDIVLGKDKSQAGATQNTAQSPATATRPSGTLVPASNGAPYPVLDSAAVYAGATDIGAGVTSRVAITAVYRK